MPERHTFSAGDEVVHPRRPEWGSGVVRLAEAITHQGAPAQRLSVDFARRGRVIINTAVAELMLRGQASMTTTSTSTSGTEGGWLSALEQERQGRRNGEPYELWELPEAMKDPFSSIERRLLATLDSYRFSTEPRSLTEWAAAQTGLNDPLTKYTRQDLEQAFLRYARDRDAHLKELVLTLKRGNQQDAIKRARKHKLPAARAALDKIMAR